MNLCRTTLLLTRPEAASRRFAEDAAREVGRFAEVLIAPLMEIVPVAADLPGAAEAEWIFTSANAVPPGGGAGAGAWCVGVRTAEAARRAGFEPRAVAPDSASLRGLILASPPGLPLVHAAGRHLREDLAGELDAAGIAARAVIVYDQRARPLDEAARARLLQPGDVLAPLFSPRSARLLAEAAADRRARIAAVAISPATAAEWRPGNSETVLTAQTPDAAGILEAMRRLFDAESPA